MRSAFFFQNVLDLNLLNSLRLGHSFINRNVFVLYLIQVLEVAASPAMTLAQSFFDEIWTKKFNSRLVESRKHSRPASPSQGATVMKDIAVKELSVHLLLAPKHKIEEEADVLVSLYHNELSKMDASAFLAENDAIKRQKENGLYLLYIFLNYCDHVITLYRAFPTVEFFSGTAFEV